MNTLYLDPVAWDLTLDASANIAMATNPYALAQDAASAIKTFLGEVWYDTTIGVPYWDEILGYPPSIEIMKSDFQAAALTVPEVTAANVFISDISGRVVSGQVQITTDPSQGTSGVIAAASF